MRDFHRALADVFKTKRSTTVTDDGKAVRVVYHQTAVVTVVHNGGAIESVILNTGGFHTATTKSRLNDACQTLCPFLYGLARADAAQVWQVKGAWKVSRFGKRAEKSAEKFVDGLEVYSSAEI